MIIEHAGFFVSMCTAPTAVTEAFDSTLGPENKFFLLPQAEPSVASAEPFGGWRNRRSADFRAPSPSCRALVSGPAATQTAAGPAAAPAPPGRGWG